MICVLSTDIHQRSQNLRRLDPGMILQGLCYLQVQRSEREDKQKQNTVQRGKIMNMFIMRLFFRVWSAQTQRPQIEPHAITQGSIGGLGSLVYICGTV